MLAPLKAAYRSTSEISLRFLRPFVDPCWIFTSDAGSSRATTSLLTAVTFRPSRGGHSIRRGTTRAAPFRRSTPREPGPGNGSPKVDPKPELAPLAHARPTPA